MFHHSTMQDVLQANADSTSACFLQKQLPVCVLRLLFRPIRSSQCNFHLYRFGNHSPITDWNLYFHDCRLTVSFSCCNTHPLSRNMHSLSHQHTQDGITPRHYTSGWTALYCILLLSVHFPVHTSDNR